MQLNLREKNKNKETLREQQCYPVTYHLPLLPSYKTLVKSLQGIGFSISANVSFKQEALSAMQ